MKATVQYGDLKGTTAADYCDLFCELPGQKTDIIFDWFNISLEAVRYQFVGVSVYTTTVEEAHTTLFFYDVVDQKVVKVERFVSLQTVLNLFKRFEFQVGNSLEDIDDSNVEEVAKIEQD